MAVIHELFGITSEELKIERTEHARTVSVLQMLKSGEAKLENLEILNENGRIRWSLTIPEKAQPDA